MQNSEFKNVKIALCVLFQSPTPLLVTFSWRFFQSTSPVTWFVNAPLEKNWTFIAPKDSFLFLTLSKLSRCIESLEWIESFPRAALELIYDFKSQNKCYFFERFELFCWFQMIFLSLKSENPFFRRSRPLDRWARSETPKISRIGNTYKKCGLEATWVLCWNK